MHSLLLAPFSLKIIAFLWGENDDCVEELLYPTHGIHVNVLPPVKSQE